MRKQVTIALVILIVIVGLFAAGKARAPKQPPPNTQQIWAEQGIPVETGRAMIGNMEQTVEVTGDINALKKATLSAKIAGRVLTVYKREGDSVRAGETVAVLDQQDALSNVQQAQGGLQTALARLSQARTGAKVTKIETGAATDQAQASLRAANARLAVVKNPSRSQDRMVAENKVASAKANLDNAEANYRRNKQLLDKGAISASAFDVIETQRTVAKADYDSAQQQFSLVKEGGRSEDVQQAQAQVDVAREQLRSARANASQNLLRQEDIKSAQAAADQARAALALAKQQLSYTYIKSPIAGQLSSRTVDPGSVVSPGLTVAEVVDLSSVYLKGDVSEKEIANIIPGQHVNVTVDAMPDRRSSGVVAQIYPSGSTLSRNFFVRIRIDGASHWLRPGMFGRGDIVTGIDRNVLLVPKDAVEERKGTKMLFTVQSRVVAKGKKSQTVSIAKRHNIDVVRENQDFSEISVPTDLRPGDIVVTSGRQNLQDGTKIAVGK